MQATFEYGTSRIKDLVVGQPHEGGKGREPLRYVEMNGRSLKTTPRFWRSLHMRFGFTENIFRYFQHAEVFQRISAVSPHDEVRWCVEHDAKGGQRMLGVSNPRSAVMRHEDLMDLLGRYGAEEIKYEGGVVTSRHATRNDDVLQIAGDDFQNKYVLDTPIDGFGRPSIYLSMLRLVCSNGAIGYNPAFRSELTVGKGEDRVEFAVMRALEGFNNEEGFAAIRQRFESAAMSWASVHEVQRLYQILVRIHHAGGVRMQAGSDGATGVPHRPNILRSLQLKAGDFAADYGLANVDALSPKRQRTLPARCKVYDLLNFASEAATHHVNEAAQRSLQSYIGELIANEYDLEGTADRFSDWQDFAIGPPEKARSPRRAR